MTCRLATKSGNVRFREKLAQNKLLGDLPLLQMLAPQ